MSNGLSSSVLVCYDHCEESMVLKPEVLVTSHALFLAVMIPQPAYGYNVSITCQFLTYWARHPPKGAYHKMD